MTKESEVRMGRMLRALVVSTRKHSEFFSRCSKRFGRERVQIGSVYLPEHLDRVEPGGEDIAVLDAVMTDSQFRTAKLWAESCSSIPVLICDSRGQNDPNVDIPKHRDTWETFHRDAQRQLAKLPKPPSKVAPPAPCRDERREAVEIKQGREAELAAELLAAREENERLRQVAKPKPPAPAPPPPTDPKVEVVEPPTVSGERREIDGWALVKLSGDTVPRILDTDLAERLEYEQPRDIRKLIDRHRQTLEKLGRIEVRATVAQTQGGRPGLQNYLTEEQAALIAAKSDMPKATEITIAMVKVFVAWGKGELPEQKAVAQVQTAADVLRLMAQSLDATKAEIGLVLDKKIEPVSAKLLELEHRQRLHEEAKEQNALGLEMGKRLANVIAEIRSDFGQRIAHDRALQLSWKLPAGDLNRSIRAKCELPSRRRWENCARDKYDLAISLLPDAMVFVASLHGVAFSIADAVAMVRNRTDPPVVLTVERPPLRSIQGGAA